MNRLLVPVLTSCLVLLGIPMIPQASVKAAEGDTSLHDDVIARVGDQAITFDEINTALNSSAVVGVSVPAIGTPRRDTVRVMLLDRFVSANLLYLDARRQGRDRDPLYLREVERFDDAVLAGLYQRHLLKFDSAVSEEEVQTYFTRNVAHGKELTPDLHAAIESKLRRDKVERHRTEAMRHIRDGVAIVVHDERFASAGDGRRADSVSLAEIDGEPVTWGSVKDRIIAAGKGAVSLDAFADANKARRLALQREIDIRVMAGKARAAGLDRDLLYQARTAEFHKTRLINLHRERLLADMEPGEETLKAFYEANRARLVQPEARKVHLVVVKTEAEAEALKARIEAGDMTMYQAAQRYSVAAGAEENLGEVGWVNQGENAPALDAAIFALGPGEISAPVETPAGWYLVRVQDMLEARYNDFGDPAARKLARREYLNDELNAYTADLRKNAFPVEVYQDTLVRLAQQEADMVKALEERAAQPGSITEQRVKELRKLLRP